jgi:hypothetical protein
MPLTDKSQLTIRPGINVSLSAVDFNDAIVAKSDEKVSLAGALAPL